MHARRVTSFYFLLKGVSSLFVAVVYTVELIYQAQRVGLNPFQLVLAGTVNQGVVFLCQTPTGALADMYSRRWAIVIGLLLIGSGFLIEGAMPTTASGPRIPLTQTWINLQISSSVRATVLSFNAQVSALAAMGGGLLIGVVATTLTTRPALLFAGLLLLPALVLYAYTIRRKLPYISTSTQEAEDSTVSQ